MFAVRQRPTPSSETRHETDTVSAAADGGHLFRSTSAWVYSTAVWVFCGICAVLAIVQEPPLTAVRVVLSFATVAVLAWAVLVRPHLSVTDAAVTVSNVWRTHVIPFGAIAYVRTRGLVEVAVHQGDGERILRSWNAPGNTARIPRRSDAQARNHLRAMGMPAHGHASALTSDSGRAQRLIEERMDAGPVPGAASTVRSSWNTAIVAAVLTALALTAVAWCV